MNSTHSSSVLVVTKRLVVSATARRIRKTPSLTVLYSPTRKMAWFDQSSCSPTTPAEVVSPINDKKQKGHFLVYSLGVTFLILVGKINSAKANLQSPLFVYLLRARGESMIYCFVDKDPLNRLTLSITQTHPFLPSFCRLWSDKDPMNVSFFRVNQQRSGCVEGCIFVNLEYFVGEALKHCLYTFWNGIHSFAIGSLSPGFKLGFLSSLLNSPAVRGTKFVTCFVETLFVANSVTPLIPEKIAITKDCNSFM